MVNEKNIGRIIQCHIDHSDPESFVVGKVICCDSDWFFMQDISSVGCWNGLALYQQCDVVSIESETEYLNRILLLISKRNEPVPYSPPISNNILESLLNYAMHTNRIIGIELCKSGYRDINGIITKINKEIVCIDQIDEYGKDDGTSYVSIDTITRCYIDDAESKCLEILIGKA